VKARSLRLAGLLNAPTPSAAALRESCVGQGTLLQFTPTYLTTFIKKQLHESAGDAWREQHKELTESPAWGVFIAKNQVARATYGSKEDKKRHAG